MALTTEQLILQMSILSDKTDPATNPNMVYKPATALNKALDPSIFTGNNTKIVNAINMVANKAESNKVAVTDAINKFNNILLDTSDFTNQQIWSALQTAMGANTIIEGITRILEGKNQHQILGLQEGDIGKVLSIGKNEKGELITKAIDMISGGSVDSNNVSYSNVSLPEITNVSDALDYIIANQSPDVIDWNAITNKPNIANKLSLSEDALVMAEDDQEISRVALTTADDINNIVGSLS